MNETFTFNGISSSTYGVYISSDAVYNAPERAVEMVSIPGRNGSLAMDEGRFENIEVTYPAFHWSSDQSGFASDISDLRNALASPIGYKRLTDDYNPNEFRLAIYRSGLSVDPTHYSTAGEFDIVFDCKPQRYLTSGETGTTFTTSGTISNPTLFDSAPLITVTGNGTLTVNGVAMVIGGTSNTVIDCELMECYDGTTSKNGDVVMTPNTFPTLSPGSNAITLTAGITKVVIIPRWWTI